MLIRYISFKVLYMDKGLWSVSVEIYAVSLKTQVKSGTNVRQGGLLCATKVVQIVWKRTRRPLLSI